MLNYAVTSVVSIHITVIKSLKSVVIVTFNENINYVF